MKFQLNHHAYFLEGDRISALDFFKGLAKEEFLNLETNPDILILSYESLNILEAKQIKEYQEQRPISGDKRFFFVGFESVTREGQNALLKVLEDPQSGSIFFLNSFSWRGLLPTVRSRLFRVLIQSSENKDEDVWKKLLSKKLKDRLETIGKISTLIKDEKISSQEAFRKSIPYVFSSLKQKNKTSDKKFLDACKLFIEKGAKKGASIKQLLETWAVLQ